MKLNSDDNDRYIYIRSSAENKIICSLVYGSVKLDKTSVRMLRRCGLVVRTHSFLIDPGNCTRNVKAEMR